MADEVMPGLGEALGGPPSVPVGPGSIPNSNASPEVNVDPQAPKLKPEFTEEGQAKAAAEAKAEVKPSEEAKPAAFADAELKVPEGIVFEGEQRKEFADLAAKFALPQEAAQGLLEYGAKMLKAAAEGYSKPFAELSESWRKEVAADPDIGGDKLGKEVLPAIGRLFDEYAADRKALVEALDTTGAGNNPHIIRLLFKAAKALNEGGPVSGNPATAPKRPDAAHALYPNLS